MPVNRSHFEILTDTGGDYQSEAIISGAILQIHFDAGTDTGAALDTGADLQVELVNSGVTIANFNNSLGSSWTRVPRVPTYDQNGTNIADAYPVAAHDRVRVTVNQSEGVEGEKQGKLYIWSGW